ARRFRRLTRRSQPRRRVGRNGGTAHRLRVDAGSSYASLHRRSSLCLPADRAKIMAPTNKLLAKLPRQELEAISPDLEPVQLPFKYVLHAPFETIEHVFFITRGVTSLVNEPETGDVVELATIGPEGMVGFPVLLKTRSVPSRAIMQIPGEGLRMKASELERALQRTPTLHNLLLRSTMALLNQIAQGASCNRLHEVQ